MRIVAKIGTSSLTDHQGDIVTSAVVKLCDEVAALGVEGHEVVIVTSGAIGAGLPALGLGGDRRPRDAVTLQAVAAVGQTRLMQVYDASLGAHGRVVGQVLLAPHDFRERRQYLQARGTLERLLELNVVPVVNENDAVADDEIRFGDNDRLAALVAHLVNADLLVLLTDTPGLLTADPRLDATASLIEEIVEVDHTLEALAGGAGTVRGSGGMASKLAAAKIAAWSGIRTVIAAADRPDLLPDAVRGVAGIGTVVFARDRNLHASRLNARKLWIAFATPSQGRLTVDQGAMEAVVSGGASLLVAGITAADGEAKAGDAVEVVGPSGEVFAKGILSTNIVNLVPATPGTSGQTRFSLGVAIQRDDLVAMP